MKLFGTFVCLAVASVGVAMAYGIITGKGPSQRQKINTSSNTQAKTNYSCEHCGASIGTDSEISPSGDVKCQYCDSWFNVNNA